MTSTLADLVIYRHAIHMHRVMYRHIRFFALPLQCKECQKVSLESANAHIFLRRAAVKDLVGWLCRGCGADCGLHGTAKP